MNTAVPVIIPLINPNEREAVLIGLNLENGMKVNRGTIVATIESTKSTLDLICEQGGFVAGLAKMVGDAVMAGEVLCYLLEQPDDSIPESVDAPVSKTDTSELPAGLRITKPALKLAAEAQLDLYQFPVESLITEAMVRAAISKTRHFVTINPSERSLILFGGGGHGKSLIELIRAGGDYQVIGILDDGIAPGESVLDIPILGGVHLLGELYRQGARLAVNGVGGIGNLNSRLRVFELLRSAGFATPVVMHPRALCEASSLLAPGSQVFANAYIGSCSLIGKGCIINTGAIISHDCRVGDYTNISPGAILAGNVEIGEKVLVGMGVTINLNVKIGAGARIGNGATIKADVPAGSVVKAGAIWPG